MSTVGTRRSPAAVAARKAPPASYVPSLIAIGLVVSLISSLGAPLIPTIAAELHISLAAAQWSLTATLLVGAVTSPLVGRLGDGPHRRTVLLVCLTLVTAGGVLAALAGGLPALVAGRALQGLGLAVMPLTIASARDHLPGRRAGSVIATLSVTTAIGVGFGYPLTGLIALQFDAAAAFWFGAIASAVMVVLAFLFVPAPSARAEPEPLDVAGAVLIGGGVLALLLAMEKGTEWGWGARSTLGLLALAIVLLALFARNELRVARPLVELRLVRHRAVLTANVSAFVLGVAMYMGISLITQVVQLPAGLDETVFVSGLTLLPMSLAAMISTRALPFVRRRAGARATIPIGTFVLGCSMLFFGLTGDALWQAFVMMGVVGFGVGFTFAAMPGLIVGAVPLRETSSAISLYQVTRYVGFSIGSGLAITLLRAFAGDAAPTEAAYRSTFLVGAALCALASLLAWVLPGRATFARAGAGDPAPEVAESELAAAGLGR
ncbi:MAG TPA: MFS transporter [Solirubrobacteraceae bacterium]|nr:MFS transporter [Solirubrobacteraceae bacterium]